MNKVPKLRFKEFSGEWNQHLLGNSIELYDNKRKPVKEQDRINGKYAYYGATGIIDYVNSYIFEGEYLLLGEDGANIITRSAPLIYKTQGKFWVNNHAHIFKPKKQFDIEFMKQCLELIDYIPYNTGTAQPKLNTESIKSISLKAPSNEEQQKIASFFSLIDKKIEKQQEKVEALKDYKKGMMQKIFSREIRFKGDNGEEYPEWEEKKAEKLFESISDKKHNGKLEVLSATQDRGVIPRSKLNIDIKYEESSLSSYKRVRKNNFIISLRSFQGGIETSKYDGLVSPAYTVFNFKENEKQNHDFFSLIFKSRNFINRLNTLIYGIRDGKAISFKDFARVKLQYPCIEEQEKIALFFLVIHKKLEKEQEKLDSLNEWKKGLLQQMFV